MHISRSYTCSSNHPHHTCVFHDLSIRNVTHSHDSCIYLIHTRVPVFIHITHVCYMTYPRDVTHSHDPCIYLIHTRVPVPIRITHVCYMTYPYVTWLIHVTQKYTSHIYVSQYPSTSHMCVTWLIHTWRDSFTRLMHPSHSYTCSSTHPHVFRDSLIYATQVKTAVVMSEWTHSYVCQKIKKKTAHNSLQDAPCSYMYTFFIFLFFLK